MIKFETDEVEVDAPLFADVSDSQFFIDSDKRLCQKYDANEAHIIAGPLGGPMCDAVGMSPDDVIKKILPKVTKITWE